MKFIVHRSFNVLIVLFALCCLPLLLGACSVREQTQECMQYMLTVKAVDAQGNDLTHSGTLTSVDIYLFDETGFVRRIPAGVSTDNLFAHSKGGVLTLVAWGNIKADSLQLPEIAVGSPIARAQLSLVQKQNGYYLPITDLFYSRQVITDDGSVDTRQVTQGNITLVLERQAAGLSVRTHYLSRCFGNTGEPCRFVVRGTGNALNFLGETLGTDAGYEPACLTDGQGDGYAAPFRIFPSEKERQIEIDIMRGGKKLFTIAEDTDGNPIVALPGQQLNIEVDFRYAKVRVTTTVAPWGEVGQDVEM